MPKSARSKTKPEAEPDVDLEDELEEFWNKQQLNPLQRWSDALRFATKQEPSSLVVKNS